MRRSILLVWTVLSAFGVWAQTSSERAAVQLWATVQASPASVTLNWTSLSSTTSITVKRKLRSATSWSALASPAASATQYVDNTIAVGTAYEYQVVRVSAGVTGTGYINTGVQVPAVDQRGKIILLVDNTMASPLANELTQLQKDLKADGWGVLRSDVSRTASVSSVRSAVLAQYNTDPANVKAVFIIGHVPVPYSGNLAPDGHSTHQGAWPCDAYYGELNGTWTDNSVNATGGYPLNVNVPGDGKFDQSDLPSAMELQVGRVDMSAMPAFSLSETELLRAYLNKAHSYKVKGYSPTVRGLMFDNLQWVANPLAASGWRSMGPLVGPANISAPYQYGPAFHTMVNGQSYLWTYSSGGGLQAVAGNTLTFNGADNIGTTQDIAAAAGGFDGVFNMAFGSYFGDWDNTNNYLRAPLANGDALTNVWSSIPAWYFHHMGMGEPIGTSVLATMNNTGLYTPLTDGWQGTIGRVHLALMGDPSLRQGMVAPPGPLTVTNSGGTALFSWSASPDAVQGYYLYEVNAAGVSTRIVPTLITGTTYQSATIPYTSGREYMVRAVKLQTTNSGSYYDLSLGVLATTAGGAVTDCLGVSGGSALPGTACNDGNACTTNDTWNSNCQCTGTSISPVATITASGSTSFCTGGSVALYANTGTGLTYQWRNNGTNVIGATGTSYTATAAGSYTVVVSTGGCSTISAATVVSTGAGPTATFTASGTTSFCSGGSVTFTANTGTGLTYQWKKNGVNLSGATASSYTATSSGSYTVVVTSTGCSSTSAASTVTVGAGPAATISTTGTTTFCSGGSVTFTANTGTGLTYQWRKNSVNISGATASSYTATASGSYGVVVSSSGCSTVSTGTTVTVNTGPTATISTPGGTSLCAVSSLTLNANTGTGFTYQWKKNAVNINGATASTYAATPTGSYTVVVSSGGCSTVSASTTITSGTSLTATITASGSTSFCSGGSVTLAANTGTGLTYQWRKDGVNIVGATASTYAATASGNYSVVLSNGGCSGTSAATTVTVGAGPAATITASGPTSFCTGGSVTLNANAGTGLSYQWKKNGTNLSGSTMASYVANSAGTYTVQVSSGGCSTVSAGTVVSIGTGASVVIGTTGSTSFCAGGSVALISTAPAGSTCQWRNNGVNINGATGTSHTATTSGSYTLVTGSGGCTSTSNGVNVTVAAAPTISCSANTTTGTVSVTATGGAAPYSYSWNTSPAQYVQSAAVSTSGTYTVTVSGSNGCSTVCSTAITMTDPCAGTRTETQATWGATAASGSASNYLTNNFAAAFPAGITIGCTRVLRLTSAAAVIAFLPASGAVAALPQGTLTNPTSSYTNQFAGELVALKISVRLDELNAAFSTSTVLLKDMVINTGTFTGWTVQQLIDEADRKIGGCTSYYTRASLNSALISINTGYVGGTTASGYLKCPTGTRSMEVFETGEPLPAFALRVFPNPTNGPTTLEIELPEELEESLMLEVRTMQGVLVHQQVLTPAGTLMQVQWDATGRAAGLYICTVRSESEGAAVARVMVQ
ncbi:MAG: hypothetical protein IT229_08870 [Flavobacteriales bacterium]|nr:hypothetical protein [Flavobacteriales bacterium]